MPKSQKIIITILLIIAIPAFFLLSHLILLQFWLETPSPGNPPKNFPTTLDKMLIYDSPKVIYSYFYSGAYAFSGFMYGRVLLDSTEEFSWENSRQSLPGYITNIDAENNLIECIRSVSTTRENDNQTTQPEYLEEEINGMKVISKLYHINSASLLQSYIFHNLTETRDSIFFDSLTVNKIGTTVHGRVGFRKHNITVREDSLGYVQKIELPIFTTANPLNLKEYDLTSHIDLPPLSTVYRLPVEMVPDSASRKQKISGYGVYKRVNLKNYYGKSEGNEH